jgi:hypothetical protein
VVSCEDDGLWKELVPDSKCVLDENMSGVSHNVSGGGSDGIIDNTLLP